jgi:hypothetical protein
MSKIGDLLAAYWDAAYAEGKEGRTTDNGTAQAALNAIEEAFSELGKGMDELGRAFIRNARHCQEETIALENTITQLEEKDPLLEELLNCCDGLNSDYVNCDSQESLDWVRSVAYFYDNYKNAIDDKEDNE